jgi:hypothetical protein
MAQVPPGVRRERSDRRRACYIRALSCRQEMVKMRHVAEIPDVGFAAPVGLPPGLEVMTLADLRAAAIAAEPFIDA